MGADFVGTALEYAQSVVRGRIVACKWVKLACKRLEQMLSAVRYGQWHPAQHQIVQNQIVWPKTR